MINKAIPMPFIFLFKNKELNRYERKQQLKKGKKYLQSGKIYLTKACKLQNL